MYDIRLPFFSLTFTVNSSSGFNTSGIEICGSKRVVGSSTNMGITPYKRNGKSFATDACGCNNEMFTNTLGVISLVIGISTFVSPFCVFCQTVFSTSVPFSILTKALPSVPEGNVIIAVSPTLYLSLSAEKTNIFEASGSFVGRFHQFE